MNDNKFIKALECCKNLDCEKCNLKARFKTATNCRNDLLVNTLDLINRQKAEIERLKSNLHRLETMSKYRVAQIDKLQVKIQGLEEAKEQLECDLVNERMNLEYAQAKVENLDTLVLSYGDYVTKTRTEAIKEFIERFEKEFDLVFKCNRGYILSKVRKVLKEMGVEG